MKRINYMTLYKVLPSNIFIKIGRFYVETNKHICCFTVLKVVFNLFTFSLHFRRLNVLPKSYIVMKVQYLFYRTTQILDFFYSTRTKFFIESERTEIWKPLINMNLDFLFCKQFFIESERSNIWKPLKRPFSA